MGAPVINSLLVFPVFIDYEGLIDYDSVMIKFQEVLQRF